MICFSTRGLCPQTPAAIASQLKIQALERLIGLESVRLKVDGVNLDVLMSVY